MRLHRPSIGTIPLILIVAAYLLMFLNRAFLQRLFSASPGDGVTLVDTSMVALVMAINVMLLSLVVWPRVVKPALITIVVSTAIAAWFMDHIGAPIDRHALASAFETDTREAREWITPAMIGWLAVFAGIPSALILWVRPTHGKFHRELGHRLLLNAALICVVFGLSIGQTRALSSLLRNHAELRHYANPFAVLHATRGYLKHGLAIDPGPPTALGRDARLTGPDTELPMLMLLAVGESARSHSFELNGYPRATNPRLSTLPVVHNFDVHSCGTNTATSLPCMFSNLGQEQFDVGAARQSENLLDVLGHAGFHVVWRDNNTGSKHIADRVTERDLARLGDRRLCPSGSCFDEVLVQNLDQDLPSSPQNTAIVLHFLGSHGPAYHDRYPARFATFQPECRSADLSACSPEQIRNSYDNTIRYTDHVLAMAIGWLQQKQGKYRTALLYVSDHGESTGEHGLYLHGAPRFMAPDEQTHVPMLAWWSPEFEKSRQLDRRCALGQQSRELSHDHYFHTVLGLTGTQTRVYRPELDVWSACRPRVPSGGALPDGMFGQVASH